MARILNKRIFSNLFIIALCFFGNVYAQRAVPGVNPQHYQQVPVQQQQYHPPPPQYQQQQQQMHPPPGVNSQQYQQPNMQYQQVPVQQQQAPQQFPQGQPQQPQPQEHIQQIHHGHHGQPQQVLHAGNMDHERAHIQEHMQVPIDTSKMSEAELQFHYFKMHDSDNNNKLDGCELIKSLIHWHEQGSKEQPNNDEQKPHVEEKVFSDEELVALIDPILQMDDTSRDGYIDYPEFIKAQQKAAAAAQIQQKQQQKQQQQQQQQQQQTHQAVSEKKSEGKIYTDQELVDIVDYVLEHMDFNKDGFIDYSEYKRSETATTP